MKNSQSQKKLHGQTAIVTGAASGFGRGIAEVFVEEGAQVVIADIDREGAELVAKSLGSSAFPYHCDVSLRTNVEDLIAACVKRFGGLDILVNNAGVTHRNQSQIGRAHV